MPDYLALQAESAGTKVDELQQTVVGVRQEKYVLGLQISVDDRVGMAICHG